MVSQTDEVADTRLATFLGLCDYLHVLVVADKMEKGCCIAFLGVTLDAITMEVMLPQDKLDKCLTLVENYRSQSHIAVSQLESLTGLLNFACRVVAPGRPFLRRLYSLKEGMKKRLPHYKLRLSAGTQQDLAMWESFLHQYNGITMFGHRKALTAHQLAIQVTVNQEGWQVEKGGHFLNGRWPLVLTVRMAAPGASLFPWLEVTKVWGETLQDHRLVMEVADKPLAQLVNTQNHKDKEVMVVVRVWVGLLLQYNIHWWQNCLQKQHVQPLCFSHPPRSSSQPEGRPSSANTHYRTPFWTGPGLRGVSRHNDGQVPQCNSHVRGLHGQVRPCMYDGKDLCLSSKPCKMADVKDPTTKFWVRKVMDAAGL